MESAAIAQRLIAGLVAKGKLPARIEQSQHGNVYFFNLFDKPESQIVSYGIATGIDADSGLALVKALTEHIERNAYFAGANRGLRSCLTDHSDGFAAFPLESDCLPGETARRARENALDEAIERYCWAVWWDQMTGARIEEWQTSTLGTLQDLVGLVNEHTPVKHYFRIVPKTSNYLDRSTVILFAELKKGGFISGGATGPTEDLASATLRAISELVRHSMGLRRHFDQGLQPATLYERRLLFFGRGEGDNLVRQRLASSDGAPIKMPALEIDEIVPHEFEDLVTVHRCHFQNQPPFVDGPVERLCL